MPVVDYFGASYLPNRKESRIKLRVAVLTSLIVFQDRETEERETKRKDLNVEGSSSNTTISNEMISGLGEDYVSQFERMSIEINSLRNENNRLIESEEARERENEALRNNNENNMIRNNKYLNGPLAYKKITAFEMWREILMFL